MKYTKKVFGTEGFEGFGSYTIFYKDGKEIATKHSPCEWFPKGSFTLQPQYVEAYEPLTRRQGYRYWKKHFPNQSCYYLPTLLEEAINKECEVSGTFFLNGEEVYYVA